MKTFFIFLGIALLVSCHKELHTIKGFTKGAADTIVLKLTWGSSTFQFSSDSTTAKTSVVNGADRITIDGQKVIDQAGTLARVHMLIIGNPRVDTGTYTAPTWFSLQLGDELISDKDFSLQVTSYQNGYLNGTFSSSRFTNGVISNLKITQ